jgi:hypothetical protein
MKPDIASKLIAALESGEFKHCPHRLHEGNRFCVIGVLCELYRRETGDGTWAPFDDEPGVYMFYGGDDFCPQRSGATESVERWAGLDSPTGLIEPEGGDWSEARSLADENDNAEDYSLAIEFLNQHMAEL